MGKRNRRQKLIIIGLILIGLYLYFFKSLVFPQEANTVFISEVCPKNQSVVRDSQKKYPGGWIELYNAGSETVNLEGYRLTNILGKQDENILPSVELEPSGFIVIYVDGWMKYGMSEENECYLDLKLDEGQQSVYLQDPSGNVVDCINVPDKMPINTSYGRIGEDTSCGAMTCTPFVSNSGALEVRLPILDMPLLSEESGFYKSDFYLTMSAEEGQNIYYTLDGSIPGPDDYLYTEPILITDSSSNDNVYASYTNLSILPYYIPEDPVDKATIVRAVAYDGSDNKSEVVTRTYFVDSDGSLQEVYGGTVPTLSIVADPEDLFGYDQGILVLGRCYDEYLDLIEGGEVVPEDAVADYKIQANFNGKNRKWEREICLSYFVEGECVLEQQVGIRTRGRASSNGPQKGFALYARDMYDGNNVLQYDIFGNDRAIKKVILKKSNCILKDGFIMSLVSDRAVLPLHYQPVFVFIDGEFWGTYTFLERYDEQFFEDYYGIDKDNLAIFKNKDIEIGTEDDQADLYDIIDYAGKNDLSRKENYELICSRIDIDSLIDYYCINIYIDNTDCQELYNVLVWKSREANPHNPYEDGKWHWALYDIDHSLVDATRNNLSEQIDEIHDAFLEHTLIKALLQNPDFCDKFIRRFLEIMDVNFSAEKVLPKYEEVTSEVRDALIRRHMRFSEGSYDGGIVDAELEQMRYFYENRERYVLQYLQEYFGLSDAEMKEFQDQVAE